MNDSTLVAIGGVNPGFVVCSVANMVCGLPASFLPCLLRRAAIPTCLQPLLDSSNDKKQLVLIVHSSALYKSEIIAEPDSLHRMRLVSCNTRSGSFTLCFRLLIEIGGSLFRRTQLCFGVVCLGGTNIFLN